MKKKKEKNFPPEKRIVKWKTAQWKKEMEKKEKNKSFFQTLLAPTLFPQHPAKANNNEKEKNYDEKKRNEKK